MAMESDQPPLETLRAERWKAPRENQPIDKSRNDRSVGHSDAGEWPAAIEYLAIALISVGGYIVSGGPLPARQRSRRD